MGILSVAVIAALVGLTVMSHKAKFTKRVFLIKKPYSSNSAYMYLLTAGLSELRPQPDPLGTAAFRSLLGLHPQRS